MINPYKEVNWKPDRQARRAFARSLVIGFPLLALALLFIGKLTTGSWHGQPAMILGGVGAGLGAILWAAPAIAKPFYLCWYAVACGIGLVVSNLLLITFYLTIVTLFGIGRRVFGRTPLQKGSKKSAVTYWRDAERIADPKRYYRQF